jgi:hypothetical protein
MTVRRIAFTRHAAAMLIERNIERKWVERALREPDATEPDPRHPNTFRSFRMIPERDNRILRVVYTENAEEFRVITTFLDRARRI